MYDEYSDYDPDWHDDDDYEKPDRDRGILGQSYTTTLYKGRKGALCLVDGILTRYEGEDWGEASGWHEDRFNLKTLTDKAREIVIRYGKTMPNGTNCEFCWSWFEDELNNDEAEIS